MHMIRGDPGLYTGAFKVVYDHPYMISFSDGFMLEVIVASFFENSHGRDGNVSCRQDWHMTSRLLLYSCSGIGDLCGHVACGLCEYMWVGRVNVRV